MPEEPSIQELMERIESLECRVADLRSERDKWIIKYFRSLGESIGGGLVEMRERATLRRQLKDTLKLLED